MAAMLFHSPSVGGAKTAVVGAMGALAMGAL